MIIIQNQNINMVPTSLFATDSEGLNLEPSESPSYPQTNDYASIRDSLLRLGIKATYRAIQSDNFVTSVSGWKLFADGSFEANEGTFRGSLEAGSVHIPDKTTADSFHTESDGDSWWGCNVADWNTDNDNAKAYILKTGIAKFQDIDIVGGFIAGWTVTTDCIKSNNNTIELKSSDTPHIKAVSSYNVNNYAQMTAASNIPRFDVYEGSVSDTCILGNFNGTPEVFYFDIERDGWWIGSYAGVYPDTSNPIFDYSTNAIDYPLINMGNATDYPDGEYWISLKEYGTWTELGHGTATISDNETVFTANIPGCVSPGSPKIRARLTKDGLYFYDADGAEKARLYASTSRLELADTFALKKRLLSSSPADHDYVGNTTNEILSGATVAAFQLVYLGSGGKWLLCDSDAIASSGGMLAMALEAKNDTEAMLVALAGTFIRDDSWTWTVGATLYAGETAGALQESIPTGADGVIRVVGWAVSADVIWFFPSSDNSTVVA